MAINKYTESLNVIYKQYAINAIKDATCLLTKLKYVWKISKRLLKKLKNTVFVLLNGTIRNKYKEGVL